MTNTKYEKRIVYGSYARKSTESEDRQVQSIETQVEHLLELQHKETLTVYQAPIEERKSAFSPGREGFNQLVKWTSQGKVNAWLCYHANRLSRNPIDAGTVIYLMDIGKLDHIKTPTSVYRNNPTDKMMLQFEFMMSKKSSDDKSVFVKDGLNRRYKKGFPTGKAPIGYLNDKTKEKGDRDWLVDTERLEKVTLILKRFLKGQDSICSITRYARDELHLRTVKRKRQGGAYVAYSGIERLLKDPIYAGFFYSLDENGITKTKRVLDESLPRPITYSEHLKILSLLGGKSCSKMQSHKATYTGFIKGKDGSFVGADHKFQLICDCKYKFSYRSRSRCPQCGIPIDHMKKPNYLSYIYYYNVKRSKNRGLKTKRVEEKNIDAYLSNYFQNNIVITPQICTWTLKYLDEIKYKALEEQKKVMQAIETERKETDKRIERLREMYLQEMIDKESYFKEYDTLQFKKEELLKHKNNTDSVDDEFQKILDLATEAMEIIENGNQEEKRSLLERLGSNLIWNEENLNVSKPKWLIEFEKTRKLMLEKYTVFEPEKYVENKGVYKDFGPLCPTLLRHWVNVRTLFFEFTRS